MRKWVHAVRAISTTKPSVPIAACFSLSFCPGAEAIEPAKGRRLERTETVASQKCHGGSPH